MAPKIVCIYLYIFSPEFQTWNETAEPLLKNTVSGRPMEVLPDFSEITDNFERLQSDVRSSFRFFGKDEDKGWQESFFTNYDEETEGKLQRNCAY